MRKKIIAEISEKKKIKFFIFSSIFLSILISVLVFFFTKSTTKSIITFFIVVVLASVFIKVRIRLNQYARIKKMEVAFPDFLQLMASNLRAGLTTDMALLNSSRKEFSPLDEEILLVGKNIMTGQKMEDSLQDMAKRINSEKIKKTIALIITGIKSGGNLGVLLSDTASSIRERDFVEKKAASSVLMYVIFIFFAIGIGAPTLFALSSVLVGVLTSILSTIPPIEASSRLPFTLSEISVSTTFITYFALTILIITNVLGSMVIGLVSKGQERAGLRYLIPLLATSLVVFFVIKIILTSYFTGIVG